MKKSSQIISKENAEKLRAWISSTSDVPVIRGRINKTAICRELGIPKSTIGTNKELNGLFVELEKQIVSIKNNSITKIESVNGKVSQLERYIIILEQRNTALIAENELLKLNGMTEALLLETGRLPR